MAALLKTKILYVIDGGKREYLNTYRESRVQMIMDAIREGGEQQFLVGDELECCS